MKNTYKPVNPQALGSQAHASGPAIRRINREKVAPPTVRTIIRKRVPVPPVPIIRQIVRMMPLAHIALHDSSVNTPPLRRIIRREVSTLEPTLPSTRRYEGDENQYRARYAHLLPASVAEADGRNDKLRLVCKLCTVTCPTSADADCFMRYLAGAPQSARGDLENHSMIFIGVEGQGQGSRLKIRKEPISLPGGRTFPAPLFGGNLRLHRTLQNSRWLIHVNADLEFNVNRLLNIRRVAAADDSAAMIFGGGGAREMGYDGKDNLAPIDLLPGEHDTARRRYFNSVTATLMNDIYRAANIASSFTDASHTAVTVSGRPTSFSLREIETCWDFPVDGIDASDVVEEMAPTFWEWGGTSGYVGNGGTLTTVFSKAENMVMYAKKRNRIRMEVRVRPMKWSRPHCFNELPSVIAELDALRVMAAKRVNDYLLGLNARRVPRDCHE